MLPNFEVLENEMIEAGEDGFQCRANQGCHIHKGDLEAQE